MRQGVIDRLVSAELESARPRSLDQHVGRGNQEKQINRLAKPREQIAAGLAGVRREAVETKSIDQQMRGLSAPMLVRQIAVKLLIDNLQLVRCKGTRIPVGGAEQRIIEELFAPYVRTDECEIAPLNADVARQFFQQGPQGALARR